MSAHIPTHELSTAEFFWHDCHPVPKLVHMVLLLALKDRATEVTFEPQQGEYRLSYRVDGKIHDIHSPPLHLAPAISQLFKVLAELDICERRMAQVGSLRLLAGGGTADVIVSISPTANGEAIRLTVEANSTSPEQIQDQLMEYRQGRGGRPVASVAPSWPQALWQFVRALAGTRTPRNGRIHDEPI